MNGSSCWDYGCYHYLSLGPLEHSPWFLELRCQIIPEWVDKCKNEWRQELAWLPWQFSCYKYCLPPVPGQAPSWEEGIEASAQWSPLAALLIGTLLLSILCVCVLNQQSPDFGRSCNKSTWKYGLRPPVSALKCQADEIQACSVCWDGTGLW